MAGCLGSASTSWCVRQGQPLTVGSRQDRRVAVGTGGQLRLAAVRGSLDNGDAGHRCQRGRPSPDALLPRSGWGDCAARNHMRERATTAVIRPPRPLPVPGGRLTLLRPLTGSFGPKNRALAAGCPGYKRCAGCTPCCPLARALRLHTPPSSPSLPPLATNQRGRRASGQQ